MGLFFVHVSPSNQEHLKLRHPSVFFFYIDVPDDKGSTAAKTVH
jgi:hypothetical protein